MGYAEVRLMAATRVDMWLQNPKVCFFLFLIVLAIIRIKYIVMHYNITDIWSRRQRRIVINIAFNKGNI